MAKSEAIYHGDPRHHHSDIVKLKAENKALRQALATRMIWALVNDDFKVKVRDG